LKLEDELMCRYTPFFLLATYLHFMSAV